MTSSRADLQRLSARIAPSMLLVYGAFVLFNCQAIAPRQSWSRQWGPMVPHESFPGDCSICHTNESWTELRDDFAFDHTRETGYVLEGAHADAACLRCHNDRGPVSAYLARGCGGCHVDPHKSAEGISCEECHDQRTWDPIGLVSEHARTRFPLGGAHAIVPCESCHRRATAGDYLGTPVECHLCHQRDAARAFPNHALNGWITACERCHTPASWRTPGFNHDGFPLAGGHAGVECLDCHAGGRFAGTPDDCYFCHQNDYIAAPDHVSQDFSTDCTECHDTDAWN